MSIRRNRRDPIEILLVEDNPGDVRLTEEALKEARSTTTSLVRDGVEALAFLRREGKFAAAPRPDMILLDLNLPRKDGREVLAEIKADPDLRHIPVVILTTSARPSGTSSTATICTPTATSPSPSSSTNSSKVVRSIESFWLAHVDFPAVAGLCETGTSIPGSSTPARGKE